MLDRRKSAEAPIATELAREVKAQGTILGSFVGSMWIIEIVDTFLGGALDGFGIRPRSLSGLLGIFFAPFLHGGFRHLIANTVPLVVLGLFIMLWRKRDIVYVSALSGLVAGVGTWLIGASNSVHIGASSIVFGFLGYLLSRGIFERRFWPIVGSIVVFFLYGGAIFGVLPGQPGISWQGHLFGFLGGILSARVMARQSIAVRAKEAARLTGGRTV